MATQMAWRVVRRGPALQGSSGLGSRQSPAKCPVTVALLPHILCVAGVLRKRSVSQHTSPPSLSQEEDVAKLCCLCLLNGNRLSQHGNTSKYKLIWNPRSASLVYELFT